MNEEEFRIIAEEAAKFYGIDLEVLVRGRDGILKLNSDPVEAVWEGARLLKQVTGGKYGTPPPTDGIPMPTETIPTTPPTPKKFSPFDDVVKKYAGELKNDNEFMAIVAAIMKTESGFNPKSMGDYEKGIPQSYGLFQMHNQGHGKKYAMSPEDRMNPDKAASKMVPEYVDKFIEGKQQGLSGADLAVFVGGRVQRPLAGLEAKYGEAFNSLISGRGDIEDNKRYLTKPQLEVQERTDTAKRMLRNPDVRGKTSDDIRREFSENYGQRGLQLNADEAEKVLPIGDKARGGSRTAAQNLLRFMGFNPMSGNPYVNSMIPRTEDFIRESQMKRILGGEDMPTSVDASLGITPEHVASSRQRIGQDVVNAMQERRIPFADPLGLLEQLRGLEKSRDTANLGQQALLQKYSPRGNAGDRPNFQDLAGIFEPQMMPMVRQGLPETLERMYTDSYAPRMAENPDLSFLDFLLKAYNR